MVATQECASTVDKSISEDSQKSELTKCAERRAHSELSRKCEGRGTGWLLESEIAQRNFKSFSDENGRTMTVSAMAVGRCEF